MVVLIELSWMFRGLLRGPRQDIQLFPFNHLLKWSFQFLAAKPWSNQHQNKWSKEQRKMEPTMVAMGVADLGCYGSCRPGKALQSRLVGDWLVTGLVALAPLLLVHAAIFSEPPGDDLELVLASRKVVTATETQPWWHKSAPDPWMETEKNIRVSRFLPMFPSMDGTPTTLKWSCSLIFSQKNTPLFACWFLPYYITFLTVYTDYYDAHQNGIIVIICHHYCSESLW